MLTKALAYAPRPGPLGAARPWIAAVFLLPLAVTAFTFANPIVLAAAGAAALLAGVLSGAGPSVRMPLRWSLGRAVLIIAVNAHASQRGGIRLRGIRHHPRAGARGGRLGLRPGLRDPDRGRGGKCRRGGRASRLRPAPCYTPCYTRGDS